MSVIDLTLDPDEDEDRTESPQLASNSHSGFLTINQVKTLDFTIQPPKIEDAFGRLHVSRTEDKTERRSQTFQPFAHDPLPIGGSCDYFIQGRLPNPTTVSRHSSSATKTKVRTLTPITPARFSKRYHMYFKHSRAHNRTGSRSKIRYRHSVAHSHEIYYLEILTTTVGPGYRICRYNLSRRPACCIFCI